MNHVNYRLTVAIFALVSTLPCIGCGTSESSDTNSFSLPDIVAEKPLCDCEICSQLPAELRSRYLDIPYELLSTSDDGVRQVQVQFFAYQTGMVQELVEDEFGEERLNLRLNKTPVFGYYTHEIPMDKDIQQVLREFYSFEQPGMPEMKSEVFDVAFSDANSTDY